MCVVELNVSLLPCRHRWYNLLRPCSPTTNLSNCPNRLRIEGWETKCDFCPHCAGWNLSNAEFRLVSNDRSSSAGGLSRSPSSNYGSARRTTHSLSRTPSLAYSSTSTVSDGSLSSFEGTQARNRAIIPALGLSVVEESEKERPSSARLDAYIRKDNMYPQSSCESDGDTEPPVKQQAEPSPETNRDDTQSQPPRNIDRNLTEDVTKDSSYKFNFRPKALRGRSIKSFLSSTTKGIWRKSLRGGRARSTEDTKLTDVAHDDVGCVRKEVPMETDNPHSFERTTDVDESLHQDLLGENEPNSHNHMSTTILNTLVKHRRNKVEDEGKLQGDTAENEKEREGIDVGANRDRQMGVEEKGKDTENDIHDGLPATLVVHEQEDAAHEAPPRVEDASDVRPACTQSALSRNKFPDYSNIVSQPPLASSDACTSAPSPLSNVAPSSLTPITQMSTPSCTPIQVSYPAVTSFFAGIGLIERPIQPGRQRLRWRCVSFFCPHTKPIVQQL